MTQEFVTLPREVVELAIETLLFTDSEEGSTAFENELKAVKKLRAALEQPQNHVEQHLGMVPAGWTLVPVEPNCSMVLAGERSLEQHDFLRLDSAYRAMLDAAPKPPTTEDSSVVQPQADQPAMTPIAQRKLDSLLSEGYTISGYSVYHERKHQHGFVTGAGLVGWWKPEGVEYPQPQGEQDPVAKIIGMDEYGPMLLWNRAWTDFPVGTKLYTHPQNLNCKSTRARLATLWGYVKPKPPRQPLTDERIDAIADAMPGGLEGFMNGWGWRQFARAVLEATNNIK